MKDITLCFVFFLMVLCLHLSPVVPVRSVIKFYPLEVKLIKSYDIILSISADHHYTLLGENKDFKENQP